MAHRILIVDDSPAVRQSVRAYIENQTDWQVCGEAEDGAIAVAKVKELSPDIVILDLHMPVMNGLEAARQISRIAPGTFMLMFTMYGTEQFQGTAKAAGINAIFSKSTALSDVVLAVRQVME